MTQEEYLALLLGIPGEGQAGKLGVIDVSGQYPIGGRPMTPEGIVLHNTAGHSLEGALSSKSPFTGQPVGYNYYVHDGRVYMRAPPETATPHALSANSPQRRPGVNTNIDNSNSISISAVAPNEESIPEGDLAVRGHLTRQLLRAFNLNPTNVWGHGELQRNKSESEGRQQAQAFRLGGPAVAQAGQPMDDPTRLLALMMNRTPAASPPPTQTVATNAINPPVQPQAGIRGPQFPLPAGYNNPPTPPTDPQAAGQGWSGWLQNPVNRAFMIQMGINMMMPTWNGPMEALAIGIGGGAEAASATAKAIRDEQQFSDKLMMDSEQKRLDRESQERREQMRTERAVDVANIKGQYILDRAKAAGARNDVEIRAFTSTYNTQLRALESQNNATIIANQTAALLGQPQRPIMSSEDIRAQAEAAAINALTAARRTAGTAVAGEVNREISPPQNPPGGRPGPTQSPSAGQNEGPPNQLQVQPTGPAPFWPWDAGQTLTVPGNKSTLTGPVRGNPPTETPPAAPPAQAPASPPPAQAPAAVAPGQQDPAAPPIGSIIPGKTGTYKYIGGPVKAPTSWQKVQ